MDLWDRRYQAPFRFPLARVFVLFCLTFKRVLSSLQSLSVFCRCGFEGLFYLVLAMDFLVFWCHAAVRVSGGEGGPCGRGIFNRGGGDSEGFNVTGFGSSTCFFCHVHWKETSTRMQKPIGGQVDR